MVNTGMVMFCSDQN